jgi:phosphoglycerol transferase
MENKLISKMNIALVNGWPCLPNTAEVEYIKRFIQAANRLGHRAYEVVTSDDIHHCEPDFVIATHEFTPKLTPYFTLGAMWSPPKFYSNDPTRIKSILSYDGYLVGSSHVREFIDALEFSTGVKKPRSDFLFLPTSLSTLFHARLPSFRFSLAYIGVHWDGLRHNRLLNLLSQADQINIYGPADSWTAYASSYRGTVPFDGNAVLETLSRHGIALCIHKEEHRNADTPSMRLFEAAAAGCLIISDEIPFARRVLGDSAFFIDLRSPAKEIAARIAEIVRWANEHPDLANSMAFRSHKILNDSYSIESLLQKCCAFAFKAKADARERRSSAVQRFSASRSEAESGTSAPRPLVDIIVRTGGRELSHLQRALQSVARQSAGRYRVLLVDYKNRADVRACAETAQTSSLQIEYLTCPDTGHRSTALWTGLRHVTAPFFAMLDDDDTVMPTHFPGLLETALEDPGHCLYYTGVVRVEEEPGNHASAVNFSGSLEFDVPERRDLKFLDRFNLAKLLKFENYIQSNAWIARSSALDKRALIDPELVVAEDMYLYFMLARKGSFKLSPTPTAYWHWRSTSGDNSMLGVEGTIWEREMTKVVLRLDQEVMHNGMSFVEMRELLGLNAPSQPIIPVRAATIDPDIATYFSPALVVGTRQRNLHEPEADGVWTSAIDASLQVKLSKPANWFALQLDFRASNSKHKREQDVEISINGEILFSASTDDWGLISARGKIHFTTATDVLFIRVRCGYTTMPEDEFVNGDKRPLGVFLSQIKYVPLLSGQSQH